MATCLPLAGHDDERIQTLDALDVVARLLAYVPDQRRHLVHDYGADSNVVRGKLKARACHSLGVHLEGPADGEGGLAARLVSAETQAVERLQHPLLLFDSLTVAWPLSFTAMQCPFRAGDKHPG